jgi:hypothetical protein
LTSEELASVRALFPDNLRPLDKLLGVHQQRLAFPGDEVLGLVKGNRSQLPDGAEWLSLVR